MPLKASKIIEGMKNVDYKDLIRKICLYVKQYSVRPFSIEQCEDNTVDKFWYILHAHNVLSIHNFQSSKMIVEADGKNAIFTKFEVNELLLEALYGIKI